MKQKLIRFGLISIALAMGLALQASALPVAVGVAQQPSAIEQVRKKSDNDKNWCERRRCRHLWGVKKKICLCHCEGGHWMGTKKSGQCFYK